MNNTDDLLEDIRLTETKKWMEANLGYIRNDLYYFDIYSTSALSATAHVVSDVTSKKFRPNIFFKIFLTCMFILFFMLIYQGNDFDTPGNKFTIWVFCILLVSIGMLNQLYALFVSSVRNYAILIDRDGININKTLYKWKDIKETAILCKPKDRSPLSYLVIIFKDDTYIKADISNFRTLEGFKNTISKYIEYFKPII